MVLGVPELDRRNLMFMAGFGALTVAIPFPKAAAAPSQPAPASPAPSAQTPAYVFADEFDGLFFQGDAQLVTCLGKGKLEAAEAHFLNSPWVIDCDGNEFYFGQRGGKWMFTAYENVNE